MLRIGLTQIFVDDQDKALAFYADKLGFQLETDAEYGPDARWLTVVAPDDPNGPRLLLAKADETALAFQQSVYEGGAPVMSFSTDDIHKTYASLVERGVQFLMEPTDMAYGGTDAVFDDGCGNKLNLHQG